MLIAIIFYSSLAHHKQRSKPAQAVVQLTKEKKANIAASFHLSLKNKGLSDELQKTNR